MYDRDFIIKNAIYFDEEIGIGENLLFCLTYIKKMNGKLFINQNALYHYRKNLSGIMHIKYRKGLLSFPRDFEIIAFNKMQSLLAGDSRVINAWKISRDWAAVATLRVLMSCKNKDKDKEEYIKLKQIIDKDWLMFIFANGVSMKQKISMLLSKISPRLEWNVYKIMFLRKEQLSQ